VTRAALAQLPGHRASRRPGRKVLIRTDGAASSLAFLDWLTVQRLSYSVGFALPNTTGELLRLMDEQVWTAAYNADGNIRDGAWVAELTGMLTLTGWPKGMRVIARKERPHPGAQLPITDPDGLRVTAFATNSTHGQLPVLDPARPAHRPSPARAARVAHSSRRPPLDRQSASTCDRHRRRTTRRTDLTQT